MNGDPDDQLMAKRWASIPRTSSELAAGDSVKVSAGRWRPARASSSVPSESAVFRYLEMFHDAGEEAMRQVRDLLPTKRYRVWGRSNADLVGFVQSRSLGSRPPGTGCRTVAQTVISAGCAFGVSWATTGRSMTAIWAQGDSGCRGTGTPCGHDASSGWADAPCPTARRAARSTLPSLPVARLRRSPSHNRRARRPVCRPRMP